MKEVIKKVILENLSKVIAILEKREEKDIEELKHLSNDKIEEIALHKDLDVISITVLIYSIYKIAHDLNDQDYKSLLTSLKIARDALKEGDLRKYNQSIRSLYRIVRKCNVRVREHLQDVMQAARVKKGALLFEKGLSIGQAAGLMGLSNWDLQQYAARTTAFEQHHEKVRAQKRVQTAFKIFGI